MTRRDELAEAACDYVLQHGVIGLSLRPLAAALGTSDRMLVYHFGRRDVLVAEILRRSTARSLALLDDLPAAGDVGAAVRALWAATTEGQLDRCQRVYEQAVAQGLLDGAPATATVVTANEAWVAGVARYLVRSGGDPSRSERCARFVDAAVMGLHLDRELALDPDLERQVVDDVAEAAVRLAGC